MQCRAEAAIASTRPALRSTASGGEEDAWWWAPKGSAVRLPHHESLLPNDPPTPLGLSGGGAGSAPTPPMPPTAAYEGRYDLPVQFDLDGLRGTSSVSLRAAAAASYASPMGYAADSYANWGAATAATPPAPRGGEFTRTSNLSNIDGDGPLQVAFNNALLLRQWVRLKAPRVSLSCRCVPPQPL